MNKKFYIPPMVIVVGLLCFIMYASEGAVMGLSLIHISITIPGRKIVSCLHKGNYTELASLYREMQEWIAAKGYKPSGASIEYYLSLIHIYTGRQLNKELFSCRLYRFFF